MSYDLRISVKPQGAPDDCYVQIAEPEYKNPTYNLGQMFRACMNWDFKQREYYPCADVIHYVEHGICQLRFNSKAYEKYNPENGWGSLSGALNTLESLRECIYQTAENVPIECMYMAW